jgi:hypothetical protein
LVAPDELSVLRVELKSTRDPETRDTQCPGNELIINYSVDELIAPEFMPSGSARRFIVFIVVGRVVVDVSA